MNHRRRASHPSRRRGFTLLELMVAMMTLAATAVIFAGSVVMAERASHVNGQYAQAISLCQHKIDELRAAGFGKLTYVELNDCGIVDDWPTTSPYSFALVDEVANYLPSPSVCSIAVDPTSDPDVKAVTVTLTWKNANHRTKTSTISLTALIANVE